LLPFKLLFCIVFALLKYHWIVILEGILPLLEFELLFEHFINFSLFG